MKKISLFLAATAVSLNIAAAQTATLTNTFGGNTDNLSGKDFLLFNEDFEKSDLNLNNRLQLDASSDKLDGRLRINYTQGEALNGANVKSQFQGYVNFKPIEQLNFVAANNFFTKTALSAAYLYAEDDATQHGKILDTNGAGAILNLNGFKAAGGFGYAKDLDLNFGASYDLNGVFSAGVTAQDVTNDSYSIGGYVGLRAVENLKLNAGYTYNFLGGYLEPTEHALQLSSSYKFENGFALYADVLSGLTNKHTSGNEKYVNKDGNDVIPVYGALRASYNINEIWTVYTKVTVQNLASTDIVQTTIYPYFDYYIWQICVFYVFSRYP